VSELSAADTRERSTNGMRPLRRLLPYVLQHKGHIALALLAMLVAAGATLSLPVAVRGMIDHGFDATNAADIDQHFIRLFAVAMVMGISAAARFYWVSWLGERVVADVRSAVYSHVIEMSPEFFERTRTGEVLSRLNTDPTLTDAGRRRHSVSHHQPTAGIDDGLCDPSRARADSRVRAQGTRQIARESGPHRRFLCGGQ
jgi:ATP-binding cassette subfamily B protein